MQVDDSAGLAEIVHLLGRTAPEVPGDNGGCLVIPRGRRSVVYKTVLSETADGLCQIEDGVMIEVIANKPDELIKVGMPQGTDERISMRV